MFHKISIAYFSIITIISLYFLINPIGSLGSTALPDYGASASPGVFIMAAFLSSIGVACSIIRYYHILYAVFLGPFMFFGFLYFAFDMDFNDNYKTLRDEQQQFSTSYDIFSSKKIKEFPVEDQLEFEDSFNIPYFFSQKVNFSNLNYDKSELLHEAFKENLFYYIKGSNDIKTLNSRVALVKKKFPDIVFTK